WKEALRDNLALIGYLVYSQLFPSLLLDRIKSNSASHHYRALDRATDKTRKKLEQRRKALARLQRVGSAHSVFHGLPYSVDKSKSILLFMSMNFDDDDSRQRFFVQRESSVISGQRGETSSSSVYGSCSSAIGLMWFSTVILGRPTTFESVVLPLSVIERSSLEERWLCPPRHLDGAIRDWETDWRGVFRAINVPHRNVAYIMLERACQDKYMDGLHVSDAYGLFKATRSAPGDAERIATLFRSYTEKTKYGIECGPVVGSLDIVRQRPVDSVGRLDGSVLGVAAKAACNTLQGGPTLFDASVGAKLTEIMAHFDSQLWKTRKRLKMAKTVSCNLDPAGLNKKVNGGRMSDPTDPKAVEMMYDMLKGICFGVWRPLKSLVGEELGASMEHPSAFLQISDQEAERLYEHAKNKGVLYSDVANLCVLLALSNCFQRSQVMREATMNEFDLVPDGTHYRQTFKDRTFKTATASASGGALPVGHFEMSADKSMMIHFVASVGHRFCDVDTHDDNRKLFANSKGEGWTQNDIRSRFKKIGVYWLGIENFSPHVCRTFWATHALDSGQVDPSNKEDFSSYLQVSSATLRSSYKIGNDVLGGVVNSACNVEISENGDEPQGPKLRRIRMEFLVEIRASLLKYSGNAKLLFRDLVKKCKVGQLGKGEKWFRRENTFWKDN
ncbi:unnamed protein product, partial [Pylaiella littoralis]